MSGNNLLSIICSLLVLNLNHVYGKTVNADLDSTAELTSGTTVHYCGTNSVQKQRWEVPVHFIEKNESTVFLFKVKDVNCKNVNLNSYYLNSSDTKKHFRFQLDGNLIIGNPDASDYFDPTQYCIVSLTDSEISFKTCNPSCTEAEPCIRKCCPLDSIYDFYARACTPALPTKWSAKVFKVAKNPDSILTENELREIHPYYRVRASRTWNNNCLYGNTQIPTAHVLPYSWSRYKELVAAGVPEDVTSVFRFRLGLDGRVQYRNPGRKWTSFPQDHYCVDGMTVVRDEEPPRYNNTVNEEILFSCPQPLDPPVRELSKYYGIFCITTSIFALITVIVYTLLFDKQTIHGWTTMSHSTSVFLFFVFLGTAHLSKNDQSLAKTGVCKFIGTMAHFFYISTFCWLLMISFDLWSTFRSLSAASRKKGFRRFLYYCCFAWGVPTLVVTVAWTLESIYINDENSEVAVPMYGADFCYLSHHFNWEFIFGPNAVLLTINLVLFIFTCIKLYQFQKSTGLATQNIGKDRQSFLLFVKLGFVVGVLWIFEILSFSVSGQDVPWYWQIFDTLNLLQPVAIFVIFVLKWEIINALHERYIVLRPVVYPVRQLLQWLSRKESETVKAATSETSNLTSVQTLNRTYRTAH